MIRINVFADKTVAVFGLARSGVAAALALRDGGANVWAWDDEDAGLTRGREAGIPIVDLNQVDWSQIAALVLAPGVPLTHPEPHWAVAKARAADVEVIGDTELFFREHAASKSRARVVGITGTNGKSTTTALTAHLLRGSGLNVEIGGNIGAAILALSPLDKTDAYVIEFSSYQIDLTPSIKPNAAALLNISPDHLDRHGTLVNYAEVKSRIFANLTDGDTAVVSVDDSLSETIADTIGNGADVVRISVEMPLSDGFVAHEGVLYAVRQGRRIACADIKSNIALRGRHNWQNAAAGYALARAIGVTPDRIAAGLKSFPGLEHRLEFVGRAGPILFVNDSKGTNAEATGRALAAYDDIFWIAGGQAKDGGIAGLDEHFPKIRHAFLVGEAAATFSETLAGRVAATDAGTIERAVMAAAVEAAKSGIAEPVILLSPACASFDQFPDFEARGRAFKTVVKTIPGFADARAGGEFG